MKQVCDDCEHELFLFKIRISFNNFFKTWLMALAQVLLGLAPITFFGWKNMQSLWTWPFFAQIPVPLKFIRLFQKKKTNLKQISNNLNHSLFSLKKSFSLLLFFVLQRNMWWLWTLPFFVKTSAFTQILNCFMVLRNNDFKSN